MIGERLQGLPLQSNATDTYEQVAYRDLTYWRIGSQYTVETNEKVSTRITLNPPTESTIHITSVCFNGTTTNGDELEYFARVYNYNSDYVVSESEWLPANTWCNVFEISYPVGGSPSGTLEIWVRRKDGGILTPSSMDRTLVTMRNYYTYEIPYQTYPADWFATTTQVPQTVTTVTCPAEYDDLVGTVPVLTPDVGGTPPEWFDQYNPIDKPWFIDILSSLADFTDVVTNISADMQIFWVFAGFVITGLLLAWH